jgi:hypothetical protein
VSDGESDVAVARPGVVDVHPLKRTGKPISFASAAAMMTSERQLPARASNVSAAVRVRTDSYSILSSPLV